MDLVNTDCIRERFEIGSDFGVKAFCLRWDLFMSNIYQYR